MRKDITKKFLWKEDRYLDKMISKGIVAFIFRKKINIDANQISYDKIEFKNIFSTEFTNLNTKNVLESGDMFKEVMRKDGKSIEFNMIYCKEDKSHSDFLLGETEVTQELYELVMGYNPSLYKGQEDSKQRPMECVTWYDAIMFCNKLSILTNKSPYYEIKVIKYEDETQTNIKKASVESNEGANGFRLPSEKEWEYAAKANTNNLWSGTNDESKLGEYAWFGVVYHKGGATHPVAQKKPNEWGFYDMSGNVYEWCYDKYDNTSDNRVFRGGSWSNDASRLRFAFRSYDSPDYRDAYLGFRVAASL